MSSILLGVWAGLDVLIAPVAALVASAQKLASALCTDKAESGLQHLGTGFLLVSRAIHKQTLTEGSAASFD